MSIMYEQKVKRLEETVAHLLEKLAVLDERIKQLEQKRGPGRPPNEPLRPAA